MSKQFKLAVAFCAVIAAPALAQDTTATDVTADTVVATVNGVEITLGHLIAARKTLPAQYLQLPDDVLFNGILDQMIQQQALAEIGEGEIDKRDELVIANERRAYLASSVLDDAATAAVTDETLQKAYDARYALAEPTTEYNAAHILVTTEEDAMAIKEELDNGADFTAIAKEKSTGPSGPNGGELGWFGPGMMVKPFEDAVIALEPGQISGPVQTEFGWHVIKLNETRIAEAPSLDDVRAELENEIAEAAVQARIREVTDAATVERATDGIDPSVLKNEALIEE
ncbi:peptidylprolyl isomerase [Ostreiculturibacter nitratireducens]|uniref:peptidylprolyl isomerase n=1 Tax=Ostreiculturibacter nitratireducens TaxID=3075226 RepID=UPI0031B5E9F0